MFLKGPLIPLMSCYTVNCHFFWRMFHNWCKFAHWPYVTCWNIPSFSVTCVGPYNHDYLNHWMGWGGLLAWLVRSSNLNPPDVYVWGLMKELMCAQTTNNKKALLQRILVVTDDISSNHYILNHIISVINWVDIWTFL